MRFKSLNRSESEKIMGPWAETGIPNNISENCPVEFRPLRQRLCKAMTLVKEKHKAEKESAFYGIDLDFGLIVYEILNESCGFYLRQASDDGVWRFLSLKVIPDIVFDRWGGNPSRFWKESRRIWLKTLWWYVHLSWQGSKDETYETLKNNTTDEIVQLVERSGMFGYRVELCRRIMEEYGKVSPENKKRNSGLFRKIMKLNTAWVKVLEPSLVQGGDKQYARNLFKYFEKRNL